jgi:AraC-like DNA-binding protein
VGEAIVEQARRLPAPELRPHVSSYTGYRVAGAAPGRHAGLPSRSMTFIVSFDEPLDIVSMPDHRQRPDTFWAMVGGLHTHPATVRHRGRQHGIQIELTPLGAVTLLRTRPADLASTVVPIGDLDQAFGGELLDRLAEETRWPQRFQVLDRLLTRLLHRGATVDAAIPAPVAAAWDRLLATDGAIAIDRLADEVGWGRRHLSEQFRRSFGLTPKHLARVVRFERAQRALRVPDPPSLATLAATCGYADQSHLTRDWHEFAGSTPSAWLAAELPFVQDADADDPAS